MLIGSKLLSPPAPRALAGFQASPASSLPFAIIAESKSRSAVMNRRSMDCPAHVGIERLAVERLAGLAGLDPGAARHRAVIRGARGRSHHRHRSRRSGGTARRGVRHVAGIERLAAERRAASPGLIPALATVPASTG
jgi:hypothetical protein